MVLRSLHSFFFKWNWPSPCKARVRSSISQSKGKWIMFRIHIALEMSWHDIVIDIFLEAHKPGEGRRAGVTRTWMKDTIHIQKKALIRKLYTHCKIKLNFIQILNYYLHTHCHVQRKNQSWKHWKKKSRCFLLNWEATPYNSASECEWIQFLPRSHYF